MKYGPTKKFVKWYVKHWLKAAQNEVEKLNTLCIQSILDNDLLTKYHFTHLYALCRFLKPRFVVETGVGLGISSTFILQALQDNGFGELYSIDCPQTIYQSDGGIEINESSYTSHGTMPGCLIPENLRKDWILLLGKSFDKLLELCESLGSIDLFFHDSEHTYQNMLWEYEAVWPYIRTHGILASHDITWNTAFHDFTQAKSCASITSRKGFGYIMLP
jgi:predicted O-methyltransferase YrrM